MKLKILIVPQLQIYLILLRSIAFSLLIKINKLKIPRMFKMNKKDLL